MPRNAADFKKEYPMRTRTPLEAIRLFCLDCQGGSPKGVVECADTTCPFFDYRHGIALSSGAHRPLAAIKTFCRKHCLPDAADDIKTCGGDTAMLGPCPVFPFRLGMNPNIRPETRERLRQIARERDPLGLKTRSIFQAQRPIRLPELPQMTQGSLL